MTRRRVVKHEIIERIYSIARAQEMTIHSLAHKAGLGYGHVWNIFKGRIRCPRFDTVVRLVRALDQSDMTIGEMKQREPNVYKFRRRA